MKTGPQSDIKTPCIGICSTGLGDSVCRGCKRYAHEIIRWNTYTDEQKRAVNERLESFLVRVVESKLHIIDAKQLQLQLARKKIAYSDTSHPAIWLYELLRACASQIDDTFKYGFQLYASYKNHSLKQIKKMIDDDFFALSQAHYERYLVIK